MEKIGKNKGVPPLKEEVPRSWIWAILWRFAPKSDTTKIEF